MSNHAARLDTAEQVKAFAMAGNARLTLVSKRTGARFTYRVRIKEPNAAGPWFVSVLTGSDNESDFAFLGTIFAPSYRRSVKSKIGETAPSAMAFAWAWAHITQGTLPAELEVWHEGRCGKCGRALTVPESIQSGIGPTCAEGM